MDADALVFLPLGGAGEIGMNLNLYGLGPADRRRWLMIDLGITFGGDGVPGVDVTMADPGFIVERRDRLDGIVLTHGHEDHLGAIPYLWPQLRCPVYGTAFTLAIVRKKLEEVSWGAEVPLIEVKPPGRFSIGRFDLEYVGMTHSIPEAHSIILRTDHGTVVHSGDWKLDAEPVIGHTSDVDTLKRVGDEGVLAFICDSTNVFVAGRSGSEGSLLEGLTQMIAGCRGRVAISSFATNVARLNTIARAARANRRDVVVSGASLKRISEIARTLGYLKGIPPFLDEREGGFLPADRMLIICTGGQGEAQAALAKLANGEHPSLKLEAGDTVIFSSRVIPGNEIAIGRLQNRLLRRGVQILTHRNGLVHVSGHPARDELREMYSLVRPQVAVPVHGELRHIIEHANLARAEGVERAVVAENGSLVQLAPGPVDVVDSIPVARLAVEGGRVVPLDGNLVRGRTKAIYNGVALVTVVVSSQQQSLVSMQISTVGLLDTEHDRVNDIVEEAVRKAIDELSFKTYKDDECVREAARLAVRRTFRQLYDKRPQTTVHVVRN